ncbi:Rieske iron-sulfur protein [Parasponia andersonii]|uniref:Rieske iron-sulfur protein n=1 Tax=Parasponia andersonii TaxID=3476 RepID=A0A2P5B8Z4_PARAD|nr:Rieske iron-sulfur protein [Parasponia andersonii]
MAASTLSPATPSQICSSKNGVFSSSQALMLKPTRTRLVGKEKGMRITCQATSIPADRVPDMSKRQLMNLLLLGAIALPTAGMLVPYATFFAPPGSGGTGGGTIAKDALGNDVLAAEWLKSHGPGDRTLTQGLKGDPTYLVVEQDRTLATYGINASLALAHADVDDGKVLFVPWVETDFRTGDDPWWA